MGHLSSRFCFPYILLSCLFFTVFLAKLTNYLAGNAPPSAVHPSIGYFGRYVPLGGTGDPRRRTCCRAGRRDGSGRGKRENWPPAGPSGRSSEPNPWLVEIRTARICEKEGRSWL